MVVSGSQEDVTRSGESAQMDLSWQAMVSLSRLFRETSTPPELTPALLEQVVGLVGGDAAAVAMHDSGSDMLTLQVASGAWSARTGEALPKVEWLQSVMAEGRPRVEECTSLGNLQLGDCKMVWCTPLIVEQGCQGVLLASTSHPAQNDALDLLALVGDWVAGIMRSRILDERLRHLYEELEEREHLISRILDSIPTSLLVVDPSLRVVSANRNFLEKGRREVQTTVGHSLNEVFPRVLLQYTQLAQKAQEVFHTGQAMEGERVAYRSPGSPTRIYYFRLFPIKTQKATENVMLLMDDITEREQLSQDVLKIERHLANVVEFANDIVASLDAQGGILTWNRAAVGLSGLGEKQVAGRPLLELCAPEQRSEMARMLQSITDERVSGTLEAGLLTAQGRVIAVSWSFSAMRDDVGHVAGIVAVGHDLSERRMLQAQLVQSAKMASLGVMAGGLAHELRNPLGVISAAVQLMREHLDDQHMLIECSERAYAATRRAALVIESLARFAQPRGAQGMCEVDLQDLLNESISLLRSQMTLSRVTLDYSVAPDLPAIEGNFGLLQQVVTNMILNACNAMPTGGTLSISAYADRPGWVVIRLADTGHGIPEENLGRIFDPFFTTMPVGRGTGLGLSISYNIIQEHQGSIEVQSQVGQGSVFSVHLPTHITSSEVPQRGKP